MNSKNKCPHNHESGEHSSQDLKGGQDYFTYKFARKALGLISNKVKFEAEYGNLSLQAMRGILESKQEERIENLSRAIDREISVYIFERLLPAIEHIEILAYDPEIHKDELGYLNEVTVNHISTNLTAIVIHILEELYGEIQLGENQRIHNIMKIQNEIHNTNQITESLKNQIIRDGIFMTVKQILSKISTLIKPLGGSFDRNGFEKLIYNDEGTWNERALSSLSLEYLASYLGEGSFKDDSNKTSEMHKDGFGKERYNVQEKAILPDLSQEEFLSLVEEVNRKGQLKGAPNTYEGCPLLYLRTHIDGDQVNGIIGYQRALYKLILDHLESYFLHESSFKKDS